MLISEIRSFLANLSEWAPCCTSTFLSKKEERKPFSRDREEVERPLAATTTPLIPLWTAACIQPNCSCLGRAAIPSFPLLSPASNAGTKVLHFSQFSRNAVYISTAHRSLYLYLYRGCQFLRSPPMKTQIRYTSTRPRGTQL